MYQDECDKYAMPVASDTYLQHGLTKRELFALEFAKLGAMNLGRGYTVGRLVSDAVEVADMLLERLEATQ